jgi:hypothetical protein
MSGLLKISSLINNAVDIVDSIVGVKSFLGIQKLVGKEKPAETGEKSENKDKDKPQTKTGLAKFNRNDEMLKSDIILKLSLERQAAILAFIDWITKKKDDGDFLAYTFKNHFNEEFERNQRDAVSKLEAVVDVIMSDLDDPNKAFEYCQQMEYTKDSTVEFLKAVKKRGLKALGGLNSTVGKSLKKEAASFKNIQKKKLEIERRLRAQRR